MPDTTPNPNTMLECYTETLQHPKHYAANMANLRIVSTEHRVYVRVVAYKCGQMLKLRYNVNTRMGHDVRRCYRTRTAKIETEPHINAFHVKSL